MRFASVRQWLIEHAALEPSLLEGAGFESHVAERVLAVGSGSEAEYLASLGSSADEVDRLTAGIAVPETWFFRYPQSFAVLTDFLERLRTGIASSVRMLSVACATGEEPYGMAMAALHAGWPADQVSIEAFDRSREALRRAGAGEYGAFSIRTEVPAWALEHLHRNGEKLVVDPMVRKLVRFTQADALEMNTLSPGADFDVIFCRNLLIYLNIEARGRLLGSLCRSLRLGGLLLVGHAETALCTHAPLQHLGVPHSFAFARVERAPVHAPEVVVPTTAVRQETLRHTTPRSIPPRPIAQPQGEWRPESVVAPTLDDAHILADAGRTAESEAMIRSIMARKGPSARALELLGMMRMASGDPAGAKGLFEQAVYLEPARAASLVQLAMISEHRGDARQATMLWDRARRASKVSAQEGSR